MLIIQDMNNNHSHSNMLLNPLLNRISLNIQQNSNQLHKQKLEKLALPKLKNELINYKKKSHTQQNRSSNGNSPKKDPVVINRWKLNRPYIQGYIQSTKNEQENSQKSDCIVKNNPRINHKQQSTDVFFTNVSYSLKRQNYTNHQEINSTIQKSKDIIKLIKANRKKLIKLKFRDATNTSHSLLESRKGDLPQKIYDYLNRRFVVKRQHIIDERVINHYINSSPAKKMQNVQQKGRKFLLQKMHTDYSNHELVEGFRKQKIKELIEKDLLQKKREFSCDYKNRYSTPYFSFLSLEKEQKINVLERNSLNSGSVFLK